MAGNEQRNRGIVCWTCEKLIGYGRKDMRRLKGSSNAKPDLD
jgi:hypothetical protein